MREAQAARFHATTFSGRVREVFTAFAGRSPARFAILVFVALILIFTLLLSLPASSASGRATPFADALFTAVSVVCVTGLSTVDMATHWSGLGHILIYTGVQIGAVGVLTLASILGLIISRRMGLRAKLMAASDSNPLRAHGGPVAEGQAIRLGEIGNLLATVALSAVVIEAAVAVVLFPRLLAHGFPVSEAALDSVYYSAMAFTNTGFAPNAAGIAPFAGDYVFLTALSVGVFLGAIGFPVIYAVAQNLRRRRHERRWSVHVKLTVTTFLILIVIGAAAYLALEASNPRTLGKLSPGDAVFQSFFLSIMTRSGGFSTIDLSHLNNSSLLLTDMLMFVGGGSASTAGGIKVTTLAVLFLAAFAEARGNTPMEAFRRRIPTDVLRVSVSIVLWGATIVSVATIIIMQMTKAPFESVLFDVISAFATCGLSTGFAASAPDPAIYVLTMTMFVGRIGTVTFAAALAQRQRGQLYQYPEERPIVG